MKKAKTILTVLLLGIAFCASGCLLVAVGAGAAGTVAYVRGDLESTLDAGMDKSYDATINGLEQLKISPIQKGKDALTAEVVARNAADKKVEIKLTRIDDKLTKIVIRIGVFGNQDQSTTILERIKQNLK